MKTKKFKDSKIHHSWQSPWNFNHGTHIVPHVIEDRRRATFRIPVGNISAEEAERFLRETINDFREEIPFPENVEIINVPGYVPTIARRNGPTPMHPIQNYDN